MTTPSDTYLSQLKSLTGTLNKYNRYSVQLSFARLTAIAIFFALIYRYFTTMSYVFLIISILLLVMFAYLIKLHSKLGWKRKILKSRMDIIEEEINYIHEKKLSFKNGKEFIDNKHFFSYDLDIFGDNSLYQHINRTATFLGSKKLAERFTNLLPDSEIISNQQAIAELIDKTEWRQNIYAIARNINDSEEIHKNITAWAKEKNTNLSKVALLASYILPAFLFSSLILTFFSNIEYAENMSIALFLGNLIFMATYTKRIKAIFIESDSISQSLERYALIFKEIETTTFSGEKLNSLKSMLKKEKSAAHEIHQLSKYFGQLENFLNLLGALISNGFFLYHIRVLHRIIAWKKKNAKEIENWLNIIGEFETLNSLANFAYNNPKYCLPNINFNNKIEFTAVGHPIIAEKSRINNDISFKEFSFVILTGSNMSGKSTFLRTLGVNMVLARIGSVICAENAHIHPLPLLVSMRVEDSLADNESYFFAEVNRLQRISQKVKQQKCFVLLDEILRGTNSDDKRKGTKEFIKTLLKSNITGIIATHDLDICALQNDFPLQIANRYFEVDILNNELSFDYQLRNGICQNQSATFLMKKMGII